VSRSSDPPHRARSPNTEPMSRWPLPPPLRHHVYHDPHDRNTTRLGTAPRARFSLSPNPPIDELGKGGRGSWPELDRDGRTPAPQKGCRDDGAPTWADRSTPGRKPEPAKRFSGGIRRLAGRGVRTGSRRGAPGHGRLADDRP
jgi:hypothetical protein